jgi:Transmembrane domain of unknown function (DUF3566)
VDEAGPTTQRPLIMAPPSRTADPDGEATDTIADNSTMSSSRTRVGNSRSGAVPRGGGANGRSSSSGDSTSADSVDTATTASTETDDENPTEAGSPDSAEDSGRGGERQGSRPTMTSGDSTRLASPKTAAAETAASATSAEAASTAAAAASTPGAQARPTTPPEPESSYSGTAYEPPSSYSRSEWSTTADPTQSRRPATASAWASAAQATRPPVQPSAGGSGAASPSGNSSYSPGNGRPSGGPSGVGRQATALAGSVASAWQKRGSTRGVQARRPAKRQAMLTLARVEPWSVMKFSFVASVVAFIILFVAVAVLYMVLSALGVFDSLQNTVSSITSSQSSSGTNISHWFSASLILGYTAMLGALNIVLITAMSTVGSVIYNLIAKTIGGIEVTLRETD